MVLLKGLEEIHIKIKFRLLIPSQELYMPLKNTTKHMFSHHMFSQPILSQLMFRKLTVKDQLSELYLMLKEFTTQFMKSDINSLFINTN